MKNHTLNALCCTIPLLLAGCDNTVPVAQKDDSGIRVKPGDDLRTIVAGAPAGARFILTKGVYRQQSFVPRDRQEFIAEPGAILNGAMVLRDWRKEGPYWVQEGLPPPLHPVGMCGSSNDPVERRTCAYREDLFLDGKVYQRVDELNAVGPGRWYFDNGRAYLSDDPSGRLAELSVTPNAISGSAKGVVLRNLTVEKYASAAQAGAIDARKSSGWQVIDVRAIWNHGVGIYISNDMVVRGGSYSYNGQMGMGGAGSRSVIEGVEIAHNNYAGFMTNWEAGGAKFVYSDGLVLRNNCVHHNKGNGLWTDIDNINIVIEGNKVFDNEGIGIAHEISYKATIRNNHVARNGRNLDSWLWGSQILVQNSQNVDVYGNVVEVAPTYGNGISLIYQNRGAGVYGPYLTANNNVRENQVTLRGLKGKSGMVADFEVERFWDKMQNRFHQNRYVVPANSGRNWSYKGDRQFADAQALGFEKNSTLKVASDTPMALSCEKAG